MSKIKTAFEHMFYLAMNRLYVSPKTEKEVVEAFHKLYYDAARFDKSFENTTWLGTKALKCPLDLWVYQELITKVRPDVIVETGTMYGGSALYMASICDMLNRGRIITVDIESRNDRPQHRRITYIHGSSTAPEIVAQVKGAIKPNEKVMVILDSDHSRDHVFNELNAYHDMVSKESYLIVEDTNINGHPVFPNFGPGPMEAVEDFMKTNTNFETDKTQEKFFLTFNPSGFLKRKQ